MRSVSLTSAKSGIQRLRDKAGARPDTLYDLENAYVTAALSVVPRPGTVLDHTLPAGTVGLTAFKGKKYVYASSQVTMTDDSYELIILKHPKDGAQPLVYIHFAEPFLGYLYVVGEFGNGDVFHYWLQPVKAWEANTAYCIGDLIEPTVPNGYSYRATRIGPPNPVWDAGGTRNIGDKREPSTPNCYYYEITNIFSAHPYPTDVTGSNTEPTWVAEEGALVYEDVNGTNSTPSLPPTTPVTGPGTPPGDVRDRYDLDRTIDSRAER